MDIEYKNVACDYDTKELGDTGTFRGYGGVFNNIDYDRDIILPGAFKKTLAEWRKKKRLPPVLWQHDTREPLGPYTKMEEDSTGLAVEGLLLVDDVRRAKEARALMMHKAIDGLSIGYITRNAKPNRADNTRMITEVELLEVSIVTMPANPKATVLDAKGRELIDVDDISKIVSLKEMEEILRDAGFSRAAATMFVAKCKKQGEPADGTKSAAAKLLATLQSATNEIGGK